MTESAKQGEFNNPFLELLGIELIRWGLGISEFGLTLATKHLNRDGSLQGGVAATMLDAACGYAGLITGPNESPGNGVTLMLTISYLSRVSTGRIRAAGRLTRSGRSLYFASAELINEQGGLIATAQGTFKRNADRSAGSL
jgi:uncharacterized protein (TIGR00369 family)